MLDLKLLASVLTLVAAVLGAIASFRRVKKAKDAHGDHVALESKLDLLMKHFGLDYSNPLVPEIRDLAREGRKIEAIKRLRERTGLGLREAKDAVDAIEAGRPVPPTDPHSAAKKLDLILEHLRIAPPAAIGDEVRDRVRSGQIVEAIRLYRANTGVGLKEAKDAVDAMARELGGDSPGVGPEAAR